MSRVSQPGTHWFTELACRLFGVKTLCEEALTYCE